MELSGMGLRGARLLRGAQPPATLMMQTCARTRTRTATAPARVVRARVPLAIRMDGRGGLVGCPSARAVGAAALRRGRVGRARGSRTRANVLALRGR